MLCNPITALIMPIQITFFSEMPSILISPFAGAVVDKYSRKKVAVAYTICKLISLALCAR